ncbi:T9SS type A sorting domain-containing protein, partial [Dokdonia sp.]
EEEEEEEDTTGDWEEEEEGETNGDWEEEEEEGTFEEDEQEEEGGTFEENEQEEEGGTFEENEQEEEEGTFEENETTEEGGTTGENTEDDDTLGVLEQNLETDINSITVFYSSQQHIITITKSELNNVNNATLFSMLGQVIKQWKPITGTNTLELPVPNMSKGPYILRLETDKGLFTEKLIIH